MLPGDAEVRADEGHGRDAAETDDDLRIHQGDLALQPVPAGILLDPQGVPVPGRAALDDVGDVDLRAVEIDDPKHIVEQVPGGAHKGHALPVLLLAGAFADEHDLRLLIAHAEDQLVPRLPQGAAPAARAFPF